MGGAGGKAPEGCLPSRPPEDLKPFGRSGEGLEGLSQIDGTVVQGTA